MPTIAILGTFDTKGPEHAFLAEAVRRKGHEPLLINVGTFGPPTIRPDIAAEIVAAAADEPGHETLLARRDRGECVAFMGRAAAKLVARLAAQERIHGIISLGGGGGTAIATAAMRALPLGFPKLMVSTLASGQTAPYVGTTDIVMMPAIVDVAGLNRLSRILYDNAAGAIGGLVTAAEARRTGAAATRTASESEKPLIVASMFGNTTACVTEAKRVLEEAGYEVLVFAATGNGGRTMEALIASGLVAGVLDLTTTEWADELVGGVLTAGPERLDAAAKTGVPAVVAPGCLDMVNFGEPTTVPAKFAGRRLYAHNPQVTLMRTTPEENRELGRILAEKLNRSTAPVTFLFPRRGLSQIGAPGGPFHDAAADDALLASLRTHLRPDIPLIEYDGPINDPAFAQLCARTLMQLM
ncbi:MAG TPA: Tm-1-like ATP-binding domain-containing protein [Opitutaceae bacterium]